MVKIFLFTFSRMKIKQMVESPRNATKSFTHNSSVSLTENHKGLTFSAHYPHTSELYYLYHPKILWQSGNFLWVILFTLLTNHLYVCIGSPFVLCDCSDVNHTIIKKKNQITWDNLNVFQLLFLIIVNWFNSTLGRLEYHLYCFICGLK